MSSKTISFIKKKLQKCYEIKLTIFSEGLNKIIETYETMLFIRGIIRYRTSTYENIKYNMWIFRVINEIFWLKRIKSRQTDTITNVLGVKNSVYSKFHTDKYSALRKTYV